MINQEITPPPELAEKLWEDTHGAFYEFEAAIAEAYRAGADAELDECCEWLEDWVGNDSYAKPLRSARRPQSQPSLKGLALQDFDHLMGELVGTERYPDRISSVRAALESLPDDPAVTTPVKHDWGEWPPERILRAADDEVGPMCEDPGYQRTRAAMAAAVKPVPSLGTMPDTPAVTPGLELTEDGLVVTDRGLEVLYWKSRHKGEAKAWRALYNLGREHGALAVTSEPVISDEEAEMIAAPWSYVTPSDPVLTADGEKPLGELMVRAYISGDNLKESVAAELRAVADWLERKWSNRAMLSYGAAVDMLRAEADRAENT